MGDPQFCVVNNQLGTGDVFVNGPFPTREAAYAWAVAFANEQAAFLAADIPNSKWTVAGDECWEMVRVHPSDDESEPEYEIVVQHLLSPQP